MFANAYQKNSKYTFPVIINIRYANGKVESALGSYFMINAEGWFFTAAHVFGFEDKKNENSAEYKDSNITNLSYWWGHDAHVLEKYILFKENDLALCKLKNIEKGFCDTFPTFKNPEKLMPGTSLCKLGFPFYEVQASFDDSKNAFRLREGTLPIPFFPLEGIFTRNIVKPATQTGARNAKFIETSSPGLKGQSGGPIFDKEGLVWAIQSQTVHLALGFEPAVVKENQSVVENQFLNVGYGVHPEAMLAIMNQCQVSYNIESQNIV